MVDTLQHPQRPETISALSEVPLSGCNWSGEGLPTNAHSLLGCWAILSVTVKEVLAGKPTTSARYSFLTLFNLQT